ncbi:MAG: hypothetical protein IKR57_02090 [Bacilli bacterium]|nr:hypothetical protein [Bacilli bacterium]
MFKYKKFTINLCTILFIILSIVELIIYLFCENNIFGLYYLLINTLIIFLLVPCAYNYKRYYSSARISKLIIVILLGIFNSYILQGIINGSINYVDASTIYIKKIFLYRCVFKGIIYVILIGFTILDSKLNKVLIKGVSNKGID